MAKNKVYTEVPLSRIERSKFDYSFPHKTAILHGDLVPVGVVEILSHDTATCDATSYVRMATPIAPMMADIDLYTVAVFVPARITWDNWQAFFGAQDEVVNISNIDNDLVLPLSIIPSLSYVDDETGNDNYYLALIDPPSVNDTTWNSVEYFRFFSIGTYMAKCADNINYLLNALPLRAYFMTWNYLFRNEYLQEPILVDTSDGSMSVSDVFTSIGPHGDFPLDYSTKDGKWINYSSPCLKVNKSGDRFTTSLPWPQVGDPATIGIGEFAPVITGETHSPDSSSAPLLWRKLGNTADYVPITNNALGLLGGQGTTMAGTLSEDSITPSLTNLLPSNLYADLRNIASVTINQLRISSAIQRMMEKDAIYGTRYDEKLMAHFGTAPSSEVLSQPQYVGGMKTAINIDTVLQTTGHQPGASSTLAEPGAVSMTYNKSSLFTQSFTEPGYLLLLAYTRQKREYSYIDRLFLRHTKLDFYWPEFAHVGYTPVYSIESGTISDIFTETSFLANDEGLFISNPDLSKQDIFGYQEYANEYRYKANMVSGFLNPEYSGSSSYWTLADNNTDREFALTGLWMVENRDNIARALTTGFAGPDYICEFKFNLFISRAMPTFGLPGETPKF